MMRTKIELTVFDEKFSDYQSYEVFALSSLSDRDIEFRAAKVKLCTLSLRGKIKAREI